MPFIGVIDGEIVWPDEVEDGATVTCPECGDSMHVRAGHTTADGILKPRCFVHNPDGSVGGMCPGGESDEHHLMKYVVSRRLDRMYQHGTVEREQKIPGTNRIGDVVVTFDGSFEEFGKGVVAEVQYRHDEKDLEAVTYEYLLAGYSVYWLNESHFTDDYEQVDLPDLIRVWPNSVPTPGEWLGVQNPVKNLKEHGERHPIEAKLPPDYFNDNRELLKQHWKLGSGNYEFDLIYSLSENNATRKCDICGNDASTYLFEDGVISTFRCESHLPTSQSELEERQEVMA